MISTSLYVYRRFKLQQASMIVKMMRQETITSHRDHRRLLGLQDNPVLMKVRVLPISLNVLATTMWYRCLGCIENYIGRNWL
jgi:hypothetical protein